MRVARLVGFVLILATYAAPAQGQTPASAQQVTQLLADLTSDDPTVRGAATADLQTVRGPAIVTPLIEAANSGAPVVRAHAIRALGRLVATAATPHLVILLNHPDEGVRGSAREALGAIGPASVQPLLAVIARSAPEGRDELAASLRVDLRNEAALALALVGPAAIDQLRQALAKAEGDSRSYVLTALAGIDDVRASDAIVAEGVSLDPARRHDAVTAAAEVLSTLIRPDELAFDRARAIAPRLVRVINNGLIDPLAEVRTQALRSAADLTQLSQMFGDYDFHVGLAFDTSAIASSAGHPEQSVREAAVDAVRQTGADEPRLTALSLDPDPVVRDAATRALAALPTDWRDASAVAADQARSVEARVEAINLFNGGSSLERDLLIRLLGDPSSEVRVSAVTALARTEGSASDSPAVNPLTTALKDSDPYVREAAVRALMEIMPNSGTEALAALVTDDDRNVQRAAIEAVGALRVVAAGPQLLALITDRAELRDAAVGAFAQLRTPTTAAELLALASHPIRAVRAAALNWLEWVRDSAEPAAFAKVVTTALGDDDPKLRMAALRLLRPAEADADLELVARALADRDVEVQRTAAGVLSGTSGARAAVLLAGLSHSDDSTLRAASVKGLGAVTDTSARERLVELITDPSEAVVQLAVYYVGQLKERRAVDALVARLRHPNSATRAAAARALGSVGDVRAAHPLLRSLKDEDRSVADTAALALGAMAAQDAVPALIDAVRLQHLPGAVDALGRLGDARAYDALLTAASDRRIGEERVISALGALGDRRAGPWLLERANRFNYAYAPNAVAALGRLRAPGTVDALVALLTSTTRGVAVSAAAALGEMGEPGSVPHLLTTFGRSLDSRDWELQRATSAAMARFGAVAVPLLTDLLSSRPADRHAVITTLAAFGPEATPALVKALETDERHLRFVTAGALANRDGALVEAALMSRLEPLDVDVVGGAYSFFLKHLDERVVDALIRALSEGAQRSSEQASAYVASGHPRLVVAGRAWLSGIQ